MTNVLSSLLKFDEVFKSVTVALLTSMVYGSFECQVLASFKSINGWNHCNLFFEYFSNFSLILL